MFLYACFMSPAIQHDSKVNGPKGKAIIAVKDNKEDKC